MLEIEPNRIAKLLKVSGVGWRPHVQPLSNGKAQSGHTEVIIPKLLYEFPQIPQGKSSEAIKLYNHIYI